MPLEMKLGESKVSQRGSVVIPKSIREGFELKEGDYLEWWIERGGSVIVKKKGETEK